MRRWVTTQLVPKVLIANQTSVIEAVADGDGAWIPGVPLISAFPIGGTAVEELAAVLTSPVATACAWHRAAGTGLAAGTPRLAPRLIEGLPWPAGSLRAAVDRLAAGDVVGCGRAVDVAYGLDRRADPLIEWWRDLLPSRTLAPAR
jgi:hypothetical protein